MLWWLYEILFWVLLVLSAPYYLSRMKRRGGYAKDFGERFGRLSPEKTAKLRNLRPLWIHAVSVGEVDLALHFIEAFRKKSDIPVVLSTTTSTGHALALRKLPSNVPIFYYPLDSRFCFRPIHRLMQP